MDTAADPMNNKIVNEATSISKCEKRVKKTTTFVRVSIAPKTVSQIVRTSRVSFSSQLASLGKYPVPQNLLCTLSAAKFKTSFTIRVCILAQFNIRTQRDGILQFC